MFNIHYFYFSYKLAAVTQYRTCPANHYKLMDQLIQDQWYQYDDLKPHRLSRPVNVDCRPNIYIYTKF